MPCDDLLVLRPFPLTATDSSALNSYMESVSVRVFAQFSVISDGVLLILPVALCVVRGT